MGFLRLLDGNLDFATVQIYYSTSSESGRIGSVINFTIPLLQLVICLPFLLSGASLAIKAVNETTLKTAETHRTEKIVTTGVYLIVRHPQYLGGLLAHVRISFLLSAWISFLFTPLMVVLIYFISRKEEEELIREFGTEYEDYKKKVPMLMPRLRTKKMSNSIA